MPYKVFYAWQMDRDKKINRWFIHKAAEAAIKTVVAGLELEDAPAVDPAEEKDVDPDAEPIELDHDTKGEPGTPPIAETILKKIENCGVFLADVSLVGDVTTDDGRKKKFPNANVMIELGAAIKSVGWERIILVMNRAFGSAEDLPFDLKHRAIKLGYDLGAGEEQTEVRKKRDALAKEIADQLKAMDKSGIITKRDTEQRLAAQASEATRKVEVESERQLFETKVAANEWNNVKGDAALLAVSIIPMVPVHLALSQTQRELVRPFVQPFDSEGWPVQPTPRSFLTVHKSGTQGLASKATELVETGSLYSAWNIMFGQDSFLDLGMGPKVEFDKPWRMRFGGSDLLINAWLERALNGLKGIGVSGPWYIGISLLKARNLILSPSGLWDLYHGLERERACSSEHIIADTTLVPHGSEATSTTIGQALRRPWKQMWRHCQYNGVPVVQDDGSVSWVE